MRIILLGILCSIFGCQDFYKANNPYTYQKAEMSYFDPMLNEVNPELRSAEEVRLVDTTYPFEMALKNDKTFWYKLDVLGEGTGTWDFEEGHLKLTAERKRFMMYMRLHKAKEFSTPILEFSDRYGPKWIEMAPKVVKM